MANDYFNALTSFVRRTLARAESATAEFDAVAAGFDKLPTERKLKEARANYCVAGGAINVYTATPDTAWASYIDGSEIVLQIPAALGNTAASTLNVSGLGALSVVRFDGSALAASDLPVGAIVTLRVAGGGTQFRHLNSHLTSNASLPLSTTNGGTGRSDGRFDAINGSQAAPSITLGDSTTGFFRSALNAIGLAIAGSNLFNFTASAFSASVPIRGADGTNSAPAVASQNDQNTGWNWPGSDTMTASLGGNERFRMTTADFLAGKTATGIGTVGAEVKVDGRIFATSDASAPLSINRKTDDGVLVDLEQDTTTEGAISVAGTTVAYGTFCGAHWSQLADNSTPEILRGTVMETIDALCAWPGEANEQLARCKVSDTASSHRVYGVFMRWSPDPVHNEAGEIVGYENPNGDMWVASLGAYLIRVAAGQEIAGGDWLESDGNGCARVMTRRYTSRRIAVITAAVVVETYPDGSLLVPCTLHCG